MNGKWQQKRRVSTFAHRGCVEVYVVFLAGPQAADSHLVLGDWRRLGLQDDLLPQLMTLHALLPSSPAPRVTLPPAVTITV